MQYIEGEFDTIKISHMIIVFNPETRLWGVEFRTPARFLFTSLPVGNSLDGYSSAMSALSAGAAFIDQNKKIKPAAKITVWIDRKKFDVYSETADLGYRFFCPKCHSGFSFKEKSEQHFRIKKAIERKRRVQEKLKRKESNDLFNIEDL